MAVFIVFLLIFFIQLFFYSYFFKKLNHQVTLNFTPFQGVSVIVCAKDEALTLPNLLPVLSNQNYPKYELIFVNDHSTDGTKGLLERFQAENNMLSVSQLAVTRMFCGSPTGVMDQEQRYVSALEASERYEVMGTQLQIFSSNGRVLLFRAQ